MKIKVNDGAIFTLIFAMFTIALFNLNTYYSALGNVLKWPLLLSIPIFLIFKYGRLKCKFTSAFYFLLSYLAVMSISTVMSPVLSIGGLAILLGYWIVFIFSFFCVTEKDKTEVICKSFGRVCNLTVWGSIIFLMMSSSWYGARFSGLHSNPNGMGSCAVIALIYTAVMFLTTKKKFHLISVIFSLIAIWLTQSRGAFIGVIIATLALLIIDKDIKKLVYFSFLGLTFYFTLDVINQLGAFEVRNIQMEVDDVRMQFIYKYINMIETKPLFGFGLSEGYTAQGRFSSELSYFDILTTSGLLGFFSLILAIIFRVIDSGLFIIKNNKIYVYEKISLIMFISILAMSFGDGYLSNIGNPLSIFIWMYLGSSLSRESEYLEVTMSK